MSSRSKNLENAVSGICALCLNAAELCESHAIPKAFIRPILRANGGSAILMPIGPGKIRRGGDVLKGKLLCAACEEITNKKIDAPAIRFLSDLKRQVDSGGGLKGNFRSKDLAIFAVSVLWRASLIRGYTPVRIDRKMRERMRALILDGTESPLKLFSVRLGRLIDRTGGFDRASLEHFIFPPSGHFTDKSQQVVTMAMHGIIFELGFPRNRAASFQKPGYLKDSATMISLPDYDIFQSQPIVAVLVDGYGKEYRGHSTLKQKRDSRHSQIAELDT
ncbi:hypothetical protein LVY75_33505 (plasmid) [Sinorhizobium sp. B11]